MKPISAKFQVHLFHENAEGYWTNAIGTDILLTTRVISSYLLIIKKSLAHDWLLRLERRFWLWRGGDGCGIQGIKRTPTFNYMCFQTLHVSNRPVAMILIKATFPYLVEQIDTFLKLNFCAFVMVLKKEDNRVIRSISDVVKNSRVVRLFSREFPFR